LPSELACYSFRELTLITLKEMRKMKYTMRPMTVPACRAVLGFLLSAALLLGLAGFAAAQQKDKKNKKDAAAADKTHVTMMTDEQQVDYQISSMLGAWQIGDAQKLHESYADDVMVVSGAWGPPIVGWANYAPLYQQQRGRMTQVRMDRSNTYIKVAGTFAWACYQWDFSATIDGQASGSQGQTTLIFEKRNDRWLIVHNHTSVVQAKAATPTAPGNTPPAPQPPANKPASR
jgi:ketosteroid isomerase-like protein